MSCIEDSPQQTTGNLNAMNFYFYIRSLDPASSCREYTRYPFIFPVNTGKCNLSGPTCDLAFNSLISVCGRGHKEDLSFPDYANDDAAGKKVYFRKSVIL